MAVREKGLEIDVLEKRISCLERRILTSEKDVRSLEGSSCLGTLNNIQKSLDKISSRYARIAALWKKMTDLETFLAPEFLEKASLTDDAKVDIIIAGEDQVRSCAEQLKQVEDLKKVVATEPLKDLPTWSAKLQPLVELHIQQKGELSAANEKLHNLLAAYNNITCHPITKDCVMSFSAEEAVGDSPASAINLLSRQFVQWDNTLTQMEQSMEVKPAD